MFSVHKLSFFQIVLHSNIVLYIVILFYHFFLIIVQAIAFSKSVAGNGFSKSAKERVLRIATNVALHGEQDDSFNIVSFAQFPVRL